MSWTRGDISEQSLEELSGEILDPYADVAGPYFRKSLFNHGNTSPTGLNVPPNDFGIKIASEMKLNVRKPKTRETQKRVRFLVAN